MKAGSDDLQGIWRHCPSVRTDKKNMSLLSSRRGKTKNPRSYRLITEIPGKVLEEILLVIFSRYMKARKVIRVVSMNL